MIFAKDKQVSKYLVFFVASVALMLVASVGVVAGNYNINFLGQRVLI